MPPNRGSGDCVRLTAWLPKDQMRQLKVALAIDGMTIQEWLERTTAAKISKSARA